jgi:hypothetical protein
MGRPPRPSVKTAAPRTGPIRDYDRVRSREGEVGEYAARCYDRRVEAEADHCHYVRESYGQYWIRTVDLGLAVTDGPVVGLWDGYTWSIPGLFRELKPYEVLQILSDKLTPPSAAPSAPSLLMGEA